MPKIPAYRHPARFQADEIVQIVLVVPELGETGGLAAPIHLLNELQRIELRIGDEVAAGALGVRDLKNRVLHAEQAFEVERRAGRGLVGVTRPAFHATLSVGRELVRVSELKIDALLIKARAQAAPIAEQPWHGRDRPLIGTRRPACKACRHDQPNCAHAIHGSAPPPLPRDCRGRMMPNGAP